MKSNTSSQMQLIGDSTLYEQKQPQVTTFGKIWNWFVSQIVKTDEPKIYAKQNRSGVTEWIIYDPATGCKACVGSEMEVRIWLDQRFRYR